MGEERQDYSRTPSERTGAYSPQRERVLIMGAAGRDFHTFNLCFRDNPDDDVVAFTAVQIPGIENRRYPSSLTGALYSEGIPIYPENELEELIAKERIDEVVFAYSDISHVALMHLASRVLACVADFGHELLYHPGETNLRRAQVLVVNKIDSAPIAGVQQVMSNIAQTNPNEP